MPRVTIVTIQPQFPSVSLPYARKTLALTNKERSIPLYFVGIELFSYLRGPPELGARIRLYILVCGQALHNI